MNFGCTKYSKLVICVCFQRRALPIVQKVAAPRHVTIAAALLIAKVAEYPTSRVHEMGASAYVTRLLEQRMAIDNINRRNVWHQ